MASKQKFSNYPNGITSFGVPVLPGSSGNVASGDVYWVDSNGQGSANGTFKAPVLTLDAAVNLTTANNGDIIYVKEGHTETIATDGGAAMDVAGITIIGLGRGTVRPTFTVATLAAATMAVSAANVSIFNLRILGNKNDLVACLEIAGDSCEVSGCEFREGAAGMLTAVTVGKADADSDNTYIHDNQFYMDEVGVTNVGNAAIEVLFDSDNIRVECNHIYGDFDDAGVSVPAGGNASDFLTIKGNYIENTAGTYAIEVTTGGSMNGGSVQGNRVVGSNRAELMEPHTLQCLDNTGSLGGTNVGSFPIPAYGLAESGATVASKSVTFTAAAHEINTAVAVFTVTGNVMARTWAHVTTAVESDAGNNGTVSLGVEDNVAILNPVVVADETNFSAQDVWANATTTVQADVMENTGGYVLISNGEDIEIDILVEDFTSGVMVLYCDWYPVSADGTVVPA